MRSDAAVISGRVRRLAHRVWQSAQESSSDERGVAMVMALLMLVVLLALTLAFVSLSSTEPTIASNHLRAAQARAMAESGLERAIWALSNPTPSPPGVAAPAPNGISTVVPYNGTSFSSMGSIGGFVITLTGVSPTEVNVQSVGWTPTNAGNDPRIKAHRTVTATLNQIKFVGTLPPAAYSARSDVSATGPLLITSQNDPSIPSCGPTAGLPGALTTGTQTFSADGPAQAYGNPGQRFSVSTTEYDGYILTDADLNMLKALAIASGTYLMGDQTFNAANPLPGNGLVFVDTGTGSNIACTPACAPAIPTVTIGANAGPGGSNTFSGMLIVNGSLVLSGATTLNAMVYAQDAITVTGPVTVKGAVMSRNISGALSSFTIPPGAQATVQLNCNNVKGAGVVPQGWFLKAGSYREPPDS